MDAMNAQPAAARETTGAVADSVATLGRSRGWTIAFGVVTLAAGVLVLTWPGQTVLVLAWLIGVQLLISGVFRLVASFSAPQSRALLAVAGVLAIVVGILVLRHPLQTVAVLVLLLGLYWVVSGTVEIVHAFSGQMSSRGWAFALGGISVVAGIVLLTFPVSSAATLALLVGLLLVVYGGATIGRGLVGGGIPVPDAPEPEAVAT
jgi:uncharacterized membrane protein HdeD (DUF308 family)